MTPEEATHEGVSAEADGGVPENTEDGQSLHEVLESAYNAQESSEEQDSSQDASPAEDAGADGMAPEDGDAAPAIEESSHRQDSEAAAPIEAPAHWAAADREMFGKLTSEGQRFLMQRSQAMEAAHTRRSQEIAPLRDLAQRWNPYFEKLNVPAPQAIDLLMQTEYKLRTGSNETKMEVLRQLVNDYSIQAPEEDGEGNFVQEDPRISQLQAQLQEMQAQQQYGVQQQQQQRYMQSHASIRNFASMRGDDGKLSHPFFGEVQADMTRLAQADLAGGVQPDLQSLYDRAVWANPVIRSKMLAQETQAKVQKAKSAGGQISGAGAPKTAQPQGLRETLEQAWDAAA